MSDKELVDLVQFKVCRETFVRIAFYGERPTQDEIDRLLEMMTLMKNAFPQRVQPMTESREGNYE